MEQLASGGAWTPPVFRPFQRSGNRFPVFTFNLEGFMLQQPSAPRAPNRLVIITLMALLVLLVRSNWTTIAMQADNESGQVIRGDILLAQDSPRFENADLIITLEAIKMADMKSVKVAELIRYKISGGGPKSDPLRFAFGEFKAAPGLTYNVQAHIDVHPQQNKECERPLGKDDFFSGALYPVLTPNQPDRLQIKVQLVR